MGFESFALFSSFFFVFCFWFSVCIFVFPFAFLCCHAVMLIVHTSKCAKCLFHIGINAMKEKSDCGFPRVCTLAFSVYNRYFVSSFLIYSLLLWFLVFLGS